MQRDERRGIDVDKAYGEALPDQWKKVEDLRRELHGIVRELEDATSAELRT